MQLFSLALLYSSLHILVAIGNHLLDYKNNCHERDEFYRVNAKLPNYCLSFFGSCMYYGSCNMDT